MLLPDARRRGEIQFLLAKGLPYNRRLAIVLGLVIAGLAVQVFAGDAGLVPGALLLLAATIMVAVRGFSNVPSEQATDRHWRSAQLEHLDKIVEIDRKSRNWDSAAIDITNPLGVVVLVLLGGAVYVGAMALADRYEWAAKMLVLDTAALLLPHWVTGVRSILTNAPLTVKVDILRAIAGQWSAAAAEGEELLPQMEMRTYAKGEIPNDVKLVLRQSRLPALLGLQVQVVLNRVQGKDYPYMYCVLVAKQELGLLTKIKPSPSSEIVVEAKTEPREDLELLVIRGRTTKTSGFHTNPAACARIFAYALSLLHQLPLPPAAPASDSPPPPPPHQPPPLPRK